MEARITDRHCEKAKQGDTLADTVIIGLQLRCEKRAKTWKLRYRLRGERKAVVIGHWPVLSPDDARERAALILRRVEKGEDPTLPEPGSLTVADLERRFFTDYANVRFNDKSMKLARACWQNYILPWFGHVRAVDLNMLVINEKLMTMTHAPYMANRVRDHIGKFLDLCEKWGVRPINTNPQKHLHRFPERAHRPDMSLEVMRNLFATIDAVEAENPSMESACLLIRLIALTGCRRDEIRTLKRSDVQLDGDDPHIFLARTKSGRKAQGTTGERKVPLGPEAVELIKRSYARRPFSQWLIPGIFTTGPLDDPTPAWRRIRDRAGLESQGEKRWRLHDLRHWFVTYLLSLGYTVDEIAKLVGHKDATVTRRVYADMLVEDVGTKHRAAQSAMSDLMMGVRR